MKLGPGTVGIQVAIHHVGRVQEDRDELLTSASDVFRKRAFYLLVVLYCVYLAEGALRKWILYDKGDWLFFIRDPFVVTLYLYCILHGLYIINRLGVLWLIAAGLTIIQGFVQYQMFGYDIVAYLLAIRSYWLYMPLIFVMPCVFNRPHIARFLSAHSILLAPYALLVATQYFGNPTDFVNIGHLPEEGAAIFTGERGRPYGLFQYYSVNVFFVSTAAALMIAGWPQIKSFPFVVRAGLIISLGLCVALTGSRRIWVLMGIVLVCAIIGMIIGRGWRRRELAAAGFGGLAGVTGVFFWFENVLTEIVQRVQEGGGVEEGILGRIWWEAFRFFEVLPEVPALGYGLGAGTTTVVRALELPVFWLGEAELERVIWELGPIMGMLVIGLRWAFALWLVVEAFAAARRGSGGAVAPAALAAIWLHNSWLSYSSVVGFQVWFITGMALALLRLAARTDAVAVHGERVVKRRSREVEGAFRSRGRFVLARGAVRRADPLGPRAR